jgi:hypothetical protein
MFVVRELGFIDLVFFVKGFNSLGRCIGGGGGGGGGGGFVEYGTLQAPVTTSRQAALKWGWWCGEGKQHLHVAWHLKDSYHDIK